MWVKMLIFCLLFGLMSSITLAQAQALEPFVVSPTCQHACFLGIEPGVTTRSQVEHILAQAGLSYTAYAPPDSAEVYQILTDNQTSELEYPFHVVDITFFIGSPDLVAYVDMLIDETPIQEIVDIFGYPSDVQTDEDHNEFVILYPDQAVVFFSGETSPNRDTVGFVHMMQLEYLMSVTKEYSLSTLPNCEPAVLCNLSTATPTPSEAPTNIPTPTPSLLHLHLHCK